MEVLFLFGFFSLPAFAAPNMNPDESTPLVTEKAPSMQQTAIGDSTQSHIQVKENTKVSWSLRIWSLLKEQTVVLLAVLFVTMFNQTSMEVYSPWLFSV